MKLLSSLLLLLCLTLLCAQGTSSDMQSLRLKVAQNPIDAESRLSLAYQLMLSGNSAEALKHYETLLKQDPEHAQAMEGSLWALQVQERYQESVERARAFLKHSPEHSSILSYQAYGLSQLGLHLAARARYARAEQLARDDAARQSAKLGLAWEYIYLQDHPSAMAMLDSSQDPQAMEFLNKARLKLSLGASTNYDGLNSGTLTVALHKAQWGLAASYEELLLDGSRFRKKLGATVDWQNPVANLKASVNTLSGRDKRVYPAVLYSLSMQPIFYLDQLLVKPSLTGHYGSYHRFDIQQADLGLQISGDRLSGGYSFSTLYQDNDALDSDTQEQLHSANLGIKAYKDAWLRAYLYLGEAAWWTNPYGIIYDDFEANSTVYGLSLSSPIGKKMGILIYSQIGTHNDETDFSSALTLSYSM